MEKGDKDWWKLAHAFYDLAHNDFKQFNQLEPELQETEIGRICKEYIQTRDSQLVDKAGYLITGSSKHWYTYLGRIM